MLENLNDYEVYTVTLEEYVSGTVAYTKDISFYTDDKNPREVVKKDAPMGGWILGKTDNEGNYQNSNVRLDYDTYKVGKSSLRFDANMPETKPNLFVAAEQKLTGLSRGCRYKLTFWAKTSGASNLIVNEGASYTKDGTSYSYWGGGIIKEQNGEPAPEWKQFTKVLTETADNWSMYEYGAEDTYDVTLQILTTKMVGTLWIDDVQLIAIDNDDDPIDGTNLITNGGFEFDGKYVTEAPEFKDKDGNKLDTLAGFSGKVYVTAGIKNIAAGSDFNGAIVMGLYNNDKLVSFARMSKTIAETKENLPSDRLSESFDITANEGDNWSVKVMYWNGLESLKPLTASVTLK